MIGKEQRSAAQVGRLFRAIGRPDARIQPQAPPRPDTLVEIDGKRIAIETTDFHGDEGERGGSALRKEEERHAAPGQIRGYWPPYNPLPRLVRRINAKAFKSYDLTGADEFWLAIFAGVPQEGAVASTSLFPMALDCQELTTLTTLTASSLENSQFVKCHIFCELAVSGPCLYSWQRGARWREVPLPGRRTDSEPSLTFWDIQKLFKKL